MEEEVKEVKKQKSYDVLCMVPFVLAYLFWIFFALLKLTDVSIKMMRFLLIFGIFLGGVSGGWILVLVKKKKIRCKIVVMISALLLVLAFAALMTSVPKVSKYALYSNNTYAAFSTNMPMWGYRSLEKAIEKTIEKEKTDSSLFEEIFRLENEDRIWVFFQVENEVDCYEFQIEDDKYYHVSSSVIVYRNLYLQKQGHSDKETIRADIEHSKTNIFTITAAPVWGVTENENVENMYINSVGVDYVKEIYDADGEKYYFWLIADGSFKENIESDQLAIEGINE